jgi:membrane-bound lytic murein transglycosylase MltF
MKLSTPNVIKCVAAGIAVIALFVLWPKGRKRETVSHPRDYSEIAASGLLRAVTEYNAISFYADGDTVSGFNYELIEAFARDKGLEVEITPEMSHDKRLQGLSEGAYDVVAYDIPATSLLKDSLLLTIPIVLTRQVLVQRKAGQDSSTYIKSQLELAQKTLYVAKGSPAIMRIHNLGNEIADTIYIEEIGKYGTEQLMAMVAHGDIDYAVTDETVAKAYIASFPQLDMNTGISFTLFYSWGVNKQSPALLDSLNTWLKAFTQTKEYKRIYQKYYD